MVDSQAGYNHLISNKGKRNNCFIKNTHKILMNLPDLILFVRINRKRQGTYAFHMSHVYQNCQCANGLDEWKIKTLAMNTFKNSLGL